MEHQLKESIRFKCLLLSVYYLKIYAFHPVITQLQFKDKYLDYLRSTTAALHYRFC